MSIAEQSQPCTLQPYDLEFRARISTQDIKSPLRYNARVHL